MHYFSTVAIGAGVLESGLLEFQGPSRLSPLGAWTCALQRMLEFKRLCGMHHIVAVQETHGNSSDEMTLSREVPTHIHYLSTIAGRAAGGIASAIDKKLLANFFEYNRFMEIVPGRAL